VSTALEHLGETPRLAVFTCGACEDVFVVGTRGVCRRFDEVLQANGTHQFIRLPACIAESRGNLTD
jgi:hypothetical protein